MLNNIEAIYAIIWAAVIGIAFAVVYTNISRTAISKFINILIDKNADSENAALTLSNMGLNSIFSIIIQRTVKSNNGLKRVIQSSRITTNAPTDEAELLLYGNKKQFKYWLKNDADTDELRKKYSYKPISFFKLIVMLVCVILTAVIMTKAAELFDGYLSSMSLSHEENKVQDEDTEDKNDLLDDEIVDSTENKQSEIEQDKDNQKDVSSNESSSTVRPSIPMGPTT